jgi:molecular chaperone DnaK (HSP70)
VHNVVSTFHLWPYLLAKIAIESIMDDVDVQSSMTRDKMMELSAPLITKLMGPVTTAMSEAGLTPADIKAGAHTRSLQSST